MFVFDTDHLGFLQLKRSSEYQNLSKRMSNYSTEDFFVSIVSFHEQVNGWTAYIARSRQSNGLVRGYEKLERILGDFSEAQVLPFSSKAADIYEELRSFHIRVGAMDMRVAAIAIANQMTVLTRNTVDFERIPNLTFDDWTTSPKS